MTGVEFGVAPWGVDEKGPAGRPIADCNGSVGPTRPDVNPRDGRGCYGLLHEQGSGAG